jgi:hypothetical protein
MGLASLAAMVPPASAGFLDFLFKSSSQSVIAPPNPSVPFVQPYATQTPVTGPRLARPPVPHRTPATQVYSGKTKGDPCCKFGEDPVAFLMHDATLRPGDAVMTRDGIRIFEGPVSAHHVRDDFSPLATAKNVESSTRAELAQVDVREGEVLPAQALVQKQSKPKAVAQLSQNVRRLALADR